jgi:hypothetical protein
MEGKKEKQDESRKEEDVNEESVSRERLKIYVTRARNEGKY